MSLGPGLVGVGGPHPQGDNPADSCNNPAEAYCPPHRHGTAAYGGDPDAEACCGGEGVGVGGVRGEGGGDVGVGVVAEGEVPWEACFCCWPGGGEGGGGGGGGREREGREGRSMMFCKQQFGNDLQSEWVIYVRT